MANWIWLLLTALQAPLLQKATLPCCWVRVMAHFNKQRLTTRVPEDATSVSLADLDNDGHLDVVVSNLCDIDPCLDGRVGVLLGNPDGSLQPVVVYDAGGYNSTWITAADLNRDGNMDVVTFSICNSVGTGCLAGWVFFWGMAMAPSNRRSGTDQGGRGASGEQLLLPTSTVTANRIWSRPTAIPQRSGFSEEMAMGHFSPQ